MVGARVNEWRYGLITTVLHLRKLVVQIILHDVDNFASAETQILRLRNMDHCQYFLFTSKNEDRDYLITKHLPLICNHTTIYQIG